MRKLNTADVFAMARIIRASGMREELRDLIQRAAGSDSPVESIGVEGFLVIMESLAERRAETAIYEALAGPLEMSADEVSKLSLDELAERSTELAEMNDLKRFFSLASRILGKK